MSDFGICQESDEFIFRRSWPPGQAPSRALPRSSHPPRVVRFAMARCRPPMPGRSSVVSARSSTPCGPAATVPMSADRIRFRVWAKHLLEPIVEVGSGDGFLARTFPSLRILSVDQSTVGLSATPDPRVAATLEHLPIRSGHARTIVAAEVLEHTGDPERCTRGVPPHRPPGCQPPTVRTDPAVGRAGGVGGPQEDRRLAHRRQPGAVGSPSRAPLRPRRAPRPALRGRLGGHRGDPAVRHGHHRAVVHRRADQRQPLRPEHPPGPLRRPARPPVDPLRPPFVGGRRLPARQPT